MAKRKTRKQGNHGAAFVVGSLFGGLIGAAAALWKTPQTGEQLRARLTEAIPNLGSDTSTLDFSTSPSSASRESSSSESTTAEA